MWISFIIISCSFIIRANLNPPCGFAGRVPVSWGTSRFFIRGNLERKPSLALTGGGGSVTLTRPPQRPYLFYRWVKDICTPLVSHFSLRRLRNLRFAPFRLGSTLRRLSVRLPTGEVFPRDG
jgi:hypothetical protein